MAAQSGSDGSPKPPPSEKRPKGKLMEKGALQTISDLKLKAFNQGFVHRNRFEENKRRLEEKKKAGDVEAARVYADFVQSFEVNDEDKNKLRFVSAGVMRGNVQEAEGGGGRGLGFEGSAPRAPAPRSKPLTFVKAGDKRTPATFRRAAREKPVPTPVLSKGIVRARTKKVRQMDLFLEELKAKQEEDEERKRRGLPSLEPKARPAAPHSVGSHDTGDPGTTNIYVGNLATTITEPMLIDVFRKYGALASVKVMWPREGAGVGRSHNCGFVAFMRRSDAAEAIDELQDMELHGSPLHLGWGKAIRLPTQPIAEPNREGFTLPAGATRVSVHPPAAAQLKAVDLLAGFVAEHGESFEQRVVAKLGEDSLFQFLKERDSDTQRFYRWRTYSLAQGDSLDEFRTEPFQMLVGGPFWIPPTAESIRDALRPPARQKRSRSRSRSRSPRGRKRARRGARMPSSNRHRFEGLLRSLTSERRKIQEAMGFALDHAEDSAEIVQIVVESLSLPETPIPKKIARLYLLSDVLYNSSAPIKHASSYRLQIQRQLPEVFKQLFRTYDQLKGRITANAMREKVLRVLRVWEGWSVFPPDFCDSLEATFLAKEIAAKAAQQPAVEKVVKAAEEVGAGAEKKGESADNVDGEPLNVDGEPLAEENEDELDGEPIDVDGESVPGDIDGEAVDIDGDPLDVDGKPVDIDGEAVDLDGEPVDVDGEALEIDGEPVDVDEIDGEPLDEAVK